MGSRAWTTICWHSRRALRRTPELVPRFPALRRLRRTRKHCGQWTLQNCSDWFTHLRWISKIVEEKQGENKLKPFRSTWLKGRKELGKEFTADIYLYELIFKASSSNKERKHFRNGVHSNSFKRQNNRSTDIIAFVAFLGLTTGGNEVEEILPFAAGFTSYDTFQGGRSHEWQPSSKASAMDPSKLYCIVHGAK